MQPGFLFRGSPKMTNSSNIVKSLLPQLIKAYLSSKWHERYLLEEIQALNIEDLGINNDIPWVKLKDSHVFYGFSPSNSEKYLYRILQNKIPHIPLECFGVVREIINRYKIPRCIPGETLVIPSRYKPLRDPLNDFNLSFEEKACIAQKFRPNKGDLVLDVGSFLGFGTLRLLDYIGSQGKIISFESYPMNLALLNLNVRRNNANNIIVVNKAVADLTGEKTLCVGGNTVNSLNGGVLNNLGYKKLEKVDVKTTTIDDSLKEFSMEKVNIVNLTINGGEYDALIGMENTIRKSDYIKITLAGWYSLPNGQRVCDLAEEFLKSLGCVVVKGKLGRVLAWKEY